MEPTTLLSTALEETGLDYKAPELLADEKTLFVLLGSEEFAKKYWGEVLSCPRCGDDIRHQDLVDELPSYQVKMRLMGEKKSVEEKVALLAKE